MKSKFIAIGGLIGILVGITLAFLEPSILRFGLSFNQNFNKGLGSPDNYYLVTSGSVYNALPEVGLLFGLIGGLVGFAVFKIAYKKD